MELQDLQIGDKVTIEWWSGDVTVDTIRAIGKEIVFLTIDNWVWPQFIKNVII